MPHRTERSPGSFRPAALLALLIAGGVAAAPAPPSDPALLLVAGLRPERLGVDSGGHLWTAGDRELRFVSPQGEVGPAVPLPPHRAVDADVQWGVAVLGPHGRELRVLGADGAPRLALELERPAAHLAWLGAERIAVSTTRAGHALEVWDLRRRAPERTLWPTEPLADPGTGTLEHSVIAAPAGDGRIFALDSVHGELRLIDLDAGTETATEGGPAAQVVRRVILPAHRLPALQEWVRDRRQRADGQAAAPLPDAHFTVLRLAVDPQGDAWVVTRCSEDRRTATLHRVPAEGEPEEVELPLDEACCSLNFTLWQEHVLFARQPPDAPARCTAFQEIP